MEGMEGIEKEGILGASNLCARVHREREAEAPCVR